MSTHQMSANNTHFVQFCVQNCVNTHDRLHMNPCFKVFFAKKNTVKMFLLMFMLALLTRFVCHKKLLWITPSYRCKCFYILVLFGYVQYIKKNKQQLGILYIVKSMFSAQIWFGMFFRQPGFNIISNALYRSLVFALISSEDMIIL